MADSARRGEQHSGATNQTAAPRAVASRWPHGGPRLNGLSPKASLLELLHLIVAPIRRLHLPERCDALERALMRKTHVMVLLTTLDRALCVPVLVYD